jgi:tetratricopeptide (TPR) repeat protein
MMTKTDKDYVNEGNKLQDKGRLEEAIQAYKYAIEIHPKSAKAYHSMGNVLIKQGQTQEAISSFRKAIEIQPDLSSSHYRLGEILRGQNSLDEAIESYQAAIDLDQKSYKFYYGLGLTLSQKEKWEEAISAYRHVIELNPSFSRAYHHLEEAQEALDRLAKAQAKQSHNSGDELQQCTLISILFLLPVQGGSGGAHSVMQEVLELYRYGVKAHIAVDEPNYSTFLDNYADIPEVKQIVIPYQTLTDLRNIANDFSVICATIYNTVNVLQELVRTNSKILPAYYIQDYEPLFSEKDSYEWKEARASYTRMPNAILFAKTQWLCHTINRNHQVKVYKVEPSIDHEVYHPNLADKSDIIRLSAMVRFKTPRRAPKRTLRVVNQLLKMFPTQIKFNVFGSHPDDFNLSEVSLSKSATILGRLTRPEVAETLRNSDIFLDLSDYQAFGRTALEAMASGCIPVVPIRGGTNEYAVPGVNSLVIDTTNEEECVNSVAQLIKKDPRELYQLKLNGIETASRYSKKRASFSILKLLYNQAIQQSK